MVHVGHTKPLSPDIIRPPDVANYEVFGPTDVLVPGDFHITRLARAFQPQDGVRVSIADPTVGVVQFNVAVGNPGQTVWLWTETQLINSFETKVIPPEAFSPWVLDTQLPAGALLRFHIPSGGITGVGYGHAFRGLEIAFLGNWLP